MTSHHNTAEVDLTAGRRRVARSRGALSGILLIVLGAWAALVPYIGPYFSFGIQPNSGDAFHWTSSRLVYDLLPGAVTVLAGIVLLISASRAATLLFAWLAAISGAWLVVGFTLDAVLKIGDPALALPPATSTGKAVAVILLYFLGTGVVIAIVAGTALGRLSVHSIRDVRAAERRGEADSRMDDRPVERPVERPDDRSVERPVERPVERSANHSDGRRDVRPEPVVPAQPAADDRPTSGGAHAADVRQDPPR